MSLNLIYGYTGIPNFGHIFFQSVGAYMAGNFTANVMNSLAPASGGLCSAASAEARRALAISNSLLTIGIFITALVLGALIGGLFGFISSYPALRLRGSHLAITLIFVGEVGRIVVRNEPGIVCGLVGLTGIPNPFIWMGNPNLSLIAYTVLALALAVFFYLVIERFSNSPFGRLLKSVRDDEVASMTLGKNVPKTRGWAMVIGSAIAAIAGVLKVFFTQGVFADDYIPLTTFVVLAMVILGGMANNRGVFLGALVLTLLDFVLTPSFSALLGVRIQFDITYVRFIVTGLLMVLILLYRPKGMIPEEPVKTSGLLLAQKIEEQ